jgi:peptidoglycan/xylan/chitin deacetylase (PgdA/CDA1 family)
VTLLDSNHDPSAVYPRRNKPAVGINISLLTFTPLESPVIHGGDGINRTSIPYREGGGKAPSFLTGFTLLVLLLLGFSTVGGESTHSTPRSEAQGMLRVDTERRFLPRLKNLGLAPSNVSKERDGNRPVIWVPILLYHRFGPIVADSMTVTTDVFEAQLKYLLGKGYTVIPLRQLVDYHLYHLGIRQSFPPRPLVITVDDGHKSVYTDMLPLLKRYNLPVTLFLYPSAISNASYAMTWNQLREIKAEGKVDFQSHTFWHPNFKEDKKKLKPMDYENFVITQLKKSKERLEKELEIKVDMLAWPFGIYDDQLIDKAVEAGYVAAFTMERHHANTSNRMMTLPRYLIKNTDKEKAFGKILAESPCS